MTANTWDLSHIFPTLAAFEAAFEAAEAALPAFVACRGTLDHSADALLIAVEARAQLAQQIERLHGYAGNASAADLRDDACQQQRARVLGLAARVDAAAAWFEPELVAASRAPQWIEADPRFAPFRYPLTAALRRAAHTLSPEAERVLALLSPVARAPGDTFDVFLAAELPWPERLIDGALVRLSPTGFVQHRSHPDRAVRRATFDAFMGALGQFRDTLGSLLATSVAAHWADAQARGFASSVERALGGEFIPRAIYDTLLVEARAGRPSLQRALRLRARALGLEELGTHDLYVPLVAHAPRFDLAASKALVLASAAPLGPDYVRELAVGLEGRWIDAYPREGKASGAYMSDAAYGVHPYVLLNHVDDWSSCTTLAHEMGHAMHTVFSVQRQPFSTARASIFVAEVASTLAENLLVHHALQRATTDDERLFYLSNEVEKLRTTFFRQVLFAEFELEIHEALERGEALTGPALSERYARLLSASMGGAVHLTDVDAHEWAYVGHFHYGFYVWQYATSLAASSLLAERVLAGEPGAQEATLALLAAGGSDDPVELLRRAGVDMTGPEPARALIRRLDGLLDQIEALLDRR